MLKGARPNRRAAPMTATLAPAPLPVRGLNLRTAYEAMDPRDAIEMVNILSTRRGLRVRNGYKDWATGLPAGDSVGSLMSYYPATAPQSGSSGPGNVQISGQMFACTNNNIYDVTTGGTGPWTEMIGAGEVTGNFWSWMNYANAGGNFLLACNLFLFLKLHICDFI